jgi:hypothetical protein
MAVDSSLDLGVPKSNLQRFSVVLVRAPGGSITTAELGFDPGINSILRVGKYLWPDGHCSGCRVYIFLKDTALSGFMY